MAHSPYSGLRSIDASYPWQTLEDPGPGLTLGIHMHPLLSRMVLFYRETYIAFANRSTVPTLFWIVRSLVAEVLLRGARRSLLIPSATLELALSVLAYTGVPVIVVMAPI